MSPATSAGHTETWVLGLDAVLIKLVALTTGVGVILGLVLGLGFALEFGASASVVDPEHEAVELQQLQQQLRHWQQRWQSEVNLPLPNPIAPPPAQPQTQPEPSQKALQLWLDELKTQLRQHGMPASDVHWDDATVADLGSVWRIQVQSHSDVPGLLALLVRLDEPLYQQHALAHLHSWQLACAGESCDGEVAWTLVWVWPKAQTIPTNSLSGKTLAFTSGLKGSDNPQGRPLNAVMHLPSWWAGAVEQAAMAPGESRRQWLRDVQASQALTWDAGSVQALGWVSKGAQRQALIQSPEQVLVLQPGQGLSRGPAVITRVDAQGVSYRQWSLNAQGEWLSQQRQLTWKGKP